MSATRRSCFSIEARITSTFDRRTHVLRVVPVAACAAAGVRADEGSSRFSAVIFPPFCLFFGFLLKGSSDRAHLFERRMRLLLSHELFLALPLSLKPLFQFGNGLALHVQLDM